MRYRSILTFIKNGEYRELFFKNQKLFSGVAHLFENKYTDKMKNKRTKLKKKPANEEH
jgi:hypothetical protein